MKERLTGAIILVALIVLLVPELLTGPIGRAPRGAAVASSPEEPPLRSYTIRLAEDAHSQSAMAHGAAEQPAPVPAPAADSSVSSSSSPATEESTRSSAPPITSLPPATHSTNAAQPSPAAAGGALAPPAAQGSGTYLVQLGSFASRGNADRLARQVRAQGFTVSVSQGSSGHLYRVRVGPVRDHGAASELAQQLRAHGHSGAIVPQ